jgi:hypothetical protein
MFDRQSGQKESPLNPLCSLTALRRQLSVSPRLWWEARPGILLSFFPSAGSQDIIWALEKAEVQGEK